MKRYQLCGDDEFMRRSKHYGHIGARIRIRKGARSIYCKECRSVFYREINPVDEQIARTGPVSEKHLRLRFESFLEFLLYGTYPDTMTRRELARDCKVSISTVQGWMDRDWVDWLERDGEPLVLMVDHEPNTAPEEYPITAESAWAMEVPENMEEDCGEGMTAPDVRAAVARGARDPKVALLGTGL